MADDSFYGMIAKFPRDVGTVNQPLFWSAALQLQSNLCMVCPNPEALLPVVPVGQHGMEGCVSKQQLCS